MSNFEERWNELNEDGKKRLVQRSAAIAQVVEECLERASHRFDSGDHMGFCREIDELVTAALLISIEAAPRDGEAKSDGRDPKQQ